MTIRTLLSVLVFVCACPNSNATDWDWSVPGAANFTPTNPSGTEGKLNCDNAHTWCAHGWFDADGHLEGEINGLPGIWIWLDVVLPSSPGDETFQEDIEEALDQPQRIAQTDAP
ncbi:MAG: hypothetical protein JST06_09445 [Bacteroidetes bacterium]|nr:hypothetical protein [Bacteroidota bacterium]MBS1629110.1 hypothetical protein [Bacteroidota bacterium]